MEIEFMEALSVLDMIKMPWINCSNKMPPDDYDYKIILNNMNHKLIESGGSLHDLVIIRMDVSALSWIPYDEETWRKLND